MKYISAEEFLKQDKEVQEALLNWWKPSIGDLYCIKQRINLFDDTTQQILQTVSFNYDEASKNLMLGFKFIAPLLTEGQLRKFIEDKTKGIVKVIQWNPCKDDGKYGYTIYILAKDRYGVLCEFGYQKLGTDLLQAYWKVACEIAKEIQNVK